MLAAAPAGGSLLRRLRCAEGTAKGVAAAGKGHIITSPLPVPQMPRFRFENFTTANGLPDNHVYRGSGGRRPHVGGNGEWPCGL